MTTARIEGMVDKCVYCYIFQKAENGGVVGYIAGKPNEYDDCKTEVTARFSRKDIPKQLDAKLVIVFGMKGEEVQRVWYNDALHAVLKKPSTILKIVGRLASAGIPLNNGR